MLGGGKRAKRPPRGLAKGAREAKRWDDPDEDSDGEEGEEQFHPQTDRGLDEEGDDASEDDLKGSDSEGEQGGYDPLASLGGLEAFTRKRSTPKGKGRGRAAEEEEEGLWDPLAGLAPRKKQKGPTGLAGAVPATSSAKQAPAAGRVAGPPEGAAVILHGLLKAPQLNGKTGTVGGPVDGATGRCPVLLADGTVKSLKAENLREVLTGAVVRLRGLQAAPELNGVLAECGELDLTAERYNVTLADGKDTLKKVKEANLEIVGRYLQPNKYVASQKKPFTWAEALQQGSERERRAWSASLELLASLALPPPRLLEGWALAKGAAAPATVSADTLPLTPDGRLACRLLAVSIERDAASPSVRPEELKRLGALAEALAKRDDSNAPTYFLVPGLCTEPLPCLRSSASLAWPLYVQLCQALVCVQTEHWPHKAWSRAEALLASQVLSKPLYLLSSKGVTGAGGVASKPAGEKSEGSWLLSDSGEDLTLGAPADGQALPGERRLLEAFCGDALGTGGWRKGAKVTWYRL